MKLKEIIAKVSKPYILEIEDEDLSYVYSQKEVKVITIDGEKCKVLTDLSNEIALKCKFPDYYGHNWMAMHECLTDMYEWLEADSFLIVIKNKKAFLSKGKKYLDSFKSVINQAGDCYSEPTPESQKNEEWARGAMPFHVVFVD